MNYQLKMRRTCPLEVRTLQRSIINSRMYLLRENGPTCWDIAENNRETINEDTVQQYNTSTTTATSTTNTNRQRLATVRVSLGDVHKCTCQTFNRTKELCRHLVWILLNKLKLKTTDPLSFQLGMSEAQLLNCLEGRENCIPTVRKSRTKFTTGKTVPRRSFSSNDSCPICLDSFDRKPVTYCRYSCGNAMHARCISIVSKHQDLTNKLTNSEVYITCPLCRGDFCTQYELQLDLRKPNLILNKSKLKPLTSFQMVCAQCDISPIVGTVYKCAACPQMIVCSACLKSKPFTVHYNHGLLVKTETNMKWKKTQSPIDIVNSLSQIKLNPLPQKVVLPRIQSKIINKYKLRAPTNTQSEVTLQCPICSDHSMNVVELECGHIVPSPSTTPSPTNETTPKRTIRRPVTGRCMLSPPRTELPPPQVVVTRAELYTRNKPIPPKKYLSLPSLEQEINNVTTSKVIKPGSRKKINQNKKLVEQPELKEEISIRLEFRNLEINK